MSNRQRRTCASRSNAPRGHCNELPAPLADVTLDLRVPAAQARAYRVRAGDYIQIIDVEGQQCSDFLAFDAAQLADGIEKGLDATTTRTLMGSAYPGPGLHSKYYDEDMRPLIEVVRDTVGRHDTFALACTAKYYEDAGYPGHPNCSDNFNAVLKPYSIRERRGWPAINFFYNTCIETSNALTSDEPWSRPGDYVLLRALTDLVCASSSCTDDIDPANGWCPTDIHVRVYDGGATFSKGSALRMTPDAEPRLTRETAFHPRLQALTRNFVDYRGFWLPTSLHRAGTDRGILVVPGRRRRDGPLGLAQIRGDGSRCRAASATHRHAQHPQARDRPGRLYRPLLRPRRDDRRRHGDAPRAQQFPRDRGG